VRQYFRREGFQSLSRGWPDVVFFKARPDGANEIIFVEVKPPEGHTIKVPQYAIKTLLEQLGADYRVAFSVDESGVPNFREPDEGRTRTIRKYYV
jgi:hypothetical protein